MCAKPADANVFLMILFKSVSFTFANYNYSYDPKNEKGPLPQRGNDPNLQGKPYLEDER